MKVAITIIALLLLSSVESVRIHSQKVAVTKLPSRAVAKAHAKAKAKRDDSTGGNPRDALQAAYQAAHDAWKAAVATQEQTKAALVTARTNRHDARTGVQDATFSLRMTTHNSPEYQAALTLYGTAARDLAEKQILVEPAWAQNKVAVADK